jgi:Lrp/AsnC family transcriptional regulator, leucine-responsive regulatory protein
MASQLSNDHGKVFLKRDHNHPPMKQDELDRLILQLLQKNGKLTNEEIGRMLQRSPSTIRDRIKGMEEDRTILGYSAIVDERRVGILADAYVSAEIDPRKESSALTGLLELQNVSEILHVTGDRRIMFRIKASDDKELLAVLDKKIQPLGFEKMEISYVMDHLICYPGL